VQPSVPAPVIDALLHDSPFTAVPQPYRLTVDVVPLDELLVIFSVPCPTGPAPAGVKFTFSIRVWPAFTVTGKVAPDTLKPVPDAVAALMVTGPVPVEYSATCCVPVVPTATLLNARLAVPTTSVGVTALDVAVTLSTGAASIANGRHVNKAARRPIRRKFPLRLPASGTLRVFDRSSQAGKDRPIEELRKMASIAAPQTAPGHTFTVRARTLVRLAALTPWQGYAVCLALAL